MSLIRRSICLAVAALFVLIANAEAQEDAGPSKEERIQKLVKLGPGVHEIKKDKKGAITSCIVIGQSRISTALGRAKGLQQARTKADLAASAEFVKWLKEDVSVFTSNEEETVILMEGKEAAEEDSLSETAKSIEKTSTKMESVAKGLVRGLIVIHKDVDGEDKNYVVVKGWSAANSEAVKRVAADLASDEPATGRSSRKSRSAGKAPDKKIDSESVTSDAADEFLK